jgi:hypothetical protein
MPRRQRLVRERARKLAQQIEDNPRSEQKRNSRPLKNQFQGHVRDIAKAYTEVAMAELIKLATKSKSENMRLLAASAILERGWGKPAQAHVGGEADDNPIRHVHEVRQTIIDPKQRDS